ncbi:hypothetical protein [Sinomonas notoginsengisoli]|uniref:hypothetical protein n=1 Tax=Sinomonas notoginsengisoli TaxID=1457311 RepID=UPI001F3A7453|nr:hypothetical protein [Sinomonas notoginsengisoli]
MERPAHRPRYQARRDDWGRAQEDSTTVHVRSAGLTDTVGEQHDGVLIMTGGRARILLDLPAAYRLASALADTLDALHTSTHQEADR